MCYFYTLNKFHIPLLIISKVPVINENITGEILKLAVIFGESVNIQLNLKKKFTTTIV
jgi:hypothetical protein